MRERMIRLAAILAGSASVLALGHMTAFADETLGFAQCSEYLNVRSGADREGEIVGKLYNNGSAIVLGQDEQCQIIL